MPWSTEMVTMIRHLINDIGSTPTYTDERIQELILITSLQVQQEATFINVYTANLDSMTLTPDPALSAPRDESFMWLTSLKCCCVLARSEFKSFSGNAFTIKDGREIIVDPTNVVKARQAIMKQFCQDYEDARYMYQLANRPSGCGIFGPFSVVTPSYYGQGGGLQTYTPRERPLFT